MLFCFPIYTLELIPGCSSIRWVGMMVQPLLLPRQKLLRPLRPHLVGRLLHLLPEAKHPRHPLVVPHQVHQVLGTRNQLRSNSRLIGTLYLDQHAMCPCVNLGFYRAAYGYDVDSEQFKQWMAQQSDQPQHGQYYQQGQQPQASS
jgi:hypothetical protein